MSSDDPEIRIDTFSRRSISMVSTSVWVYGCHRDILRVRKNGNWGSDVFRDAISIAERARHDMTVVANFGITFE